MIIDMHTHPYDENCRRLPARTREEAITGFVLQSDDLWEGWFETMQQLSINHSVVFGPFSDNDWTARVIACYQPHLIGFAHVFPLEGAPACDELKRAVEELGLRGLKLYAWPDGCAFGSPETQAVVRTAYRLRIPVVFDCATTPYHALAEDWRVKHYGEAGCFAGLSTQVSDPRPMLTPQYLEGMENVTLILAHLGGGIAEDQPELVMAYPNIYLDTAAWVNEGFAGSAEEAWHLQRIKQAVQAIGAARIIFGSDDRQAEALAGMARLEVTAPQRAMIMGENAARILKLAG
jgi:uncharacterized protein